MQLTDDDIRALVSRRVAETPPALAFDELLSHPVGDVRLRRATETQTRTRSLGLIAAALVAILVGGLVVLARRPDTSAPQSSSAPLAYGEKVGRYFRPTGLPDDFRLLGVFEHAVPASPPAPAWSTWHDADASIRVRLDDSDDDPSTSGFDQQSVRPDGRIVRWSHSFDMGDLTLPTSFLVEVDGRFVRGQIRGAIDPDRLMQLADSIEPGSDGIPVLDDTAYTQAMAVPPAVLPIVAQLSAYYGPPGGYLGQDSIEVVTTRFANPIDVAAQVGIWDDTTQVGDRTIQLGFLGLSTTWYAGPDLMVAVQTNGSQDGLTVIGRLEEIDEATFAAEVGEIESIADSLPIGESVTFPSGERADLLGDRTSPRGVCLTVGDARRCNLAVMARAGYTYDDTIAVTVIDLLIGQQWYTVGLQIAADSDFEPGPLPAGAEVVSLDDRDWFLVEHPADAEYSELNELGFGTPARPAR